MSSLRLGCILAALVAVLGAAVPTAPSAGAVRAEVQQFFKSYVKAQNKVDASAIMELVSKKPGVASISMGEITRGWEDIRKDVDSMVGSEGVMKIAIGTIDVEPLGPNFALAFAPCTITLAVAQGGLQVRGAVTLIVEKSEGKWKLIHEHTSAQITENEGK